MRNVFNRFLGCLSHCLPTGQKFDPGKAFPVASTAAAVMLDSSTSYQLGNVRGDRTRERCLAEREGRTFPSDH